MSGRLIVLALKLSDYIRGALIRSESVHVFAVSSEHAFSLLLEHSVLLNWDRVEYYRREESETILEELLRVLNFISTLSCRFVLMMNGVMIS